MAELERHVYFYDKNKWNSDEAYADACERIRIAYETDKLRVDDLINAYDYEVE